MRNIQKGYIPNASYEIYCEPSSTEVDNEHLFKKLELDYPLIFNA